MPVSTGDGQAIRLRYDRPAMRRPGLLRSPIGLWLNSVGTADTARAVVHERPDSRSLPLIAGRPLVSVFRHRNRQPTFGPSGPHRFVDPSDVRSALALAAMQPNAQMGPALAVTDASLRGKWCAMAGCRKPRQDPIHEPSDDENRPTYPEDEQAPEPEPPSLIRRLHDHLVRRSSP